MPGRQKVILTAPMEQKIIFVDLCNSNQWMQGFKDDRELFKKPTRVGMLQYAPGIDDDLQN